MQSLQKCKMENKKNLEVEMENLLISKLIIN